MKVPPTYKNRNPMGPGTIGIQSGELLRYTDFSRALVHLGRPEGTKLAWVKSIDIVGSANQIVEMTEGEWLFLMGDDHVFDPDILLRLLAHNLDVVVPLCLQRQPPYAPVVYKSQEPESGSYYVYDDLPKKGVVEVFAAGNAGMLIRKHVLDALEPPYFRAAENKSVSGEDLYFCRKVREAGFKIHCDVETHLGHIANYTIWPTIDEGEWAIGLELSRDQTLTLKRGRTVAPPVAA